MIELATCLWIAAGVLAGLTHAAMLWRAAGRSVMWMQFSGTLRLAVVVTVLVAAALQGQIIASASGWAIGFSACVTYTVLCLASRATVDRRVHPHE